MMSIYISYISTHGNRFRYFPQKFGKTEKLIPAFMRHFEN